MKDEHDDFTVDCLPTADEHQSLPRRGISGSSAGCKPKRQPRGFNMFRSVNDWESIGQPTPEGAKLVLAPGMYGGHFVPVSFVAKDWNVTPRRIRALLAEGRLLGRLLDNGYWEVRFPYSFTFGTRGPSLKRQQRPKKQLKNVERIVE